MGRSALVASAIAAMAACGSNNNASSNEARKPNAQAPADQSAANQHAPATTVTGCLQQGGSAMFACLVSWPSSRLSRNPS
jgi:hypothetical protein